MRLLATRSPTRCAVCHDDLGGAGVACPGCDAKGHADCWRDLGRCTSLGCAVRASPDRRGGRLARLLDVAGRVASTLAGPSVRARPRVRAGSMSLAELVTVVAIVGLLAAVVRANLVGGCGRNRVVRTYAVMRETAGALERFRADQGSYPATLNALWSQGHEPYLENPAMDPWGNDFGYRLAADGRFEIVSYGADGAPGGEEEGTDLSSRTINNQDTGGP